MSNSRISDRSSKEDCAFQGGDAMHEVTEDLEKVKGPPRPQQQHHYQLSTTERLKACLKDSSMTDVVLQGDDGVQVPAIRCVLGSASPVLKQLLYSTNSIIHNNTTGISHPTKQQGVVPIPGFRQRTLHTLVEYCCSDGELSSCALFAEKVLGVATIFDMLAFLQLAISYEIATLPQQIVDEFVIPSIKRNPPLACLVFDYLLTTKNQQRHLATHSYSDGSIKANATVQSLENEQIRDQVENVVVVAATALGKLYTSSLHIIRTQPYQALQLPSTTKPIPATTRSCIGVVHADTLQKIVADKEVQVDELFLLRVVQYWRDYHQELQQQQEELHREQNKPLHKINNILLQKTQLAKPQQRQPPPTTTNQPQQTQTPHQKYFTNLKREKVSPEEFPLFEAHFQDNSPFASINLDAPATSILNTTTSSTICSDSTIDNKSKYDEATTDTITSVSTNRQQPYICPNPTEVCRRQLIPHIDLAAIDPTQLKKIVKSANQDSSFIDQQQLIDTLWQQATLASMYSMPRLSFSSIVRRTTTDSSNDNANAPWTTTNSPNCDSKATNNNFAQLQYYQSHILVQGAGVKDCNGIYTQVVAQPPSSCTEDCNVNEWDDSDNGTLCTRKTENTTPYHRMSPSRSAIGTSTTEICLRFVKQGNHSQRRKKKSKVWYLVCTREPTPQTALGVTTTSSFLHYWTLMEEDNSDDQLRVLYEWEMDGVIQDAASLIQDNVVSRVSYSPDAAYGVGNSNNTGKNSASFVVDGSTLQLFPEHGWSSVKSKFAPAPTLTWCRPRHGAAMLVVPPSQCTPRYNKSNERKSLRALTVDQQRRRKRTNKRNIKKTTIAWQDGDSYSRLNDETLLDTLAGLALTSVPSEDVESESGNTSTSANNENSAPKKQAVTHIKT